MRVVCVGDSITFGQYLPLGVPAWPERMGATGRGVCGETTRQALERFPRDVQENPADVTVLQWGHNDANRWKSDNGLPRVSRRAFRANLREMVARCRAVGTRPVLCTLTPTLKDIDYDTDVSAYNRAVWTVASKDGVQVADVHTTFRLTDTHSLLLPDGLHLSDAGHELYAATVSEAVYPALVAA